LNPNEESKNEIVIDNLIKQKNATAETVQTQATSTVENSGMQVSAAKAPKSIRHEIFSLKAASNSRISNIVNADRGD